MRRWLVVLAGVLAVVMVVRHAPSWIARMTEPPAASGPTPPGALEYFELSDGTTIALFDNRLEVRGPAMGDTGFQRIYVDDLRRVEAKDTMIEIETDEAVLTLGLGSRLRVLALKSAMDKARARAGAH